MTRSIHFWLNGRFILFAMLFVFHPFQCKHGFSASPPRNRSDNQKLKRRWWGICCHLFVALIFTRARSHFHRCRKSFKKFFYIFIIYIMAGVFFFLVATATATQLTSAREVLDTWILNIWIKKHRANKRRSIRRHFFTIGFFFFLVFPISLIYLRVISWSLGSSTSIRVNRETGIFENLFFARHSYWPESFRNVDGIINSDLRLEWNL